MRKFQKKPMKLWELPIISLLTLLSIKAKYISFSFRIFDFGVVLYVTSKLGIVAQAVKKIRDRKERNLT